MGPVLRVEALPGELQGADARGVLELRLAHEPREGALRARDLEGTAFVVPKVR